MEATVRLALIILAAVIIFVIFLDYWYKRKRFKASAHFETPEYQISDPQDLSLRAHAFCGRGNPERPGSPRLSASQPRDDDNATTGFPNDLLVMSIIAKPGNFFVAYDLLQAILATGMKFGEMNIFHYTHQKANGTAEKLFSLALATEPGEFDLDRIGELSATGLTLFMQLPFVSNPPKAFAIFLKTAEQLAEDLGGELRAGSRMPWNKMLLQDYQEKILHYPIV